MTTKQWTRAIGRLLNSPPPPPPPSEDVPAWLAQITETDKLYHIGDALQAPTQNFVWPGGAMPGSCYGGADVFPGMLAYGYGGGIWVPDLGRHGALVFSGTGEDVFAELMTQLTISDDSPKWLPYQQPAYCTSEAEAAARDADWYYSVADWTALVADPARKTYPDMAGWYALWVAAGKPWPIGHYAGWVWRRPMKHTLGDWTPYAFRYQIADYVPPEMSGLGAGAIVTSYKSLCGPFASGGGLPPGTGAPNDADFWAETWPSGSRKYYVRYKDTSTGKWAQCRNPLPEFNGYSGNYQALNISFVDTVAKRVYYTGFLGSTFGLVYMDCANGLADAVPSAFLSMGGNPAGTLDGASNVVFTDRSPAGQKLLFIRLTGYDNSLFIIDAAARMCYSALNIPGMNFGADSFWAFSYDESANKIHITARHTSGATKRCAFVVPADPTVAANYAATTVELDASGVTLDPPTWQYGKRSKLIPKLGVVVLTQMNQRALVYKPRP